MNNICCNNKEIPKNNKSGYSIEAFNIIQE